MHAYMCVHTRMGIYQHVHDSARVHVYVHAYVRVCTFCNTLPHIEVGLAGFAAPHPILKSFPRLCYMFFIARNSIFEYWEITSPASTH